MGNFKKLFFNTLPQKFKKFIYHYYLNEQSNKNYYNKKINLIIKDINFSLLLKDQSSYLTYSKFLMKE